MKNFIYLLLIVFLSGCASSKKHLERVEYDAAVQKSVAKLRKNPSKTKEIEVLRQALKKANEVDKDRISFLKTSGQPNIWYPVYTHYMNLKNRQDIVKTLPDVILNDLRFNPINYDQDIVHARQNAAEYLYAHAESLLEKNDKYRARDAFMDLQKIKEFYSDYRDIDAKMQEALYKGTNNVLFKIENHTDVVLPERFEEELLKISMQELNSQWINYHTRSIKDYYYDYVILLKLHNIFVSPEQVKEERFTDEKEIEDGFKYMLDSKGNVVKDTAGNDIKIPVLKVITCHVTTTHQHKRTAITGTLDYYDNFSGQLVKTDPISVETVFDNLSANFAGDQRALKPESRKLLKSRPLPFPPDPEMIMMTGEKLKSAAKSIIYRNKHLIKQ